MTNVFGFMAWLCAASALVVVLARFFIRDWAVEFGLEQGFVGQAIMCALALWFMQIVVNRLESIEYNTRKTAQKNQ